MTELSERAGWLSHLESHYGRSLALDVSENVAYLRRAARQVADGTHPSLHANAEGTPRTPMTANEILQHIIRVSCDDLDARVTEARKVIETARTIPENLLADFVRHETLPKWNEAMAEAGFVWDAKHLRWKES
jgi:hypothetical protein